MSERKLSEKEKIREAKVNKMIEEKEKEGYVKKDLVMSGLFANVAGIGTAIVGAVLFGVPFLMMYGFHHTLMADLMIVLGFIIGLFVHEGIHGLFFAMRAKNPKNSIEFGVSRESFCPYCTCSETISKGGFITAIMMPGLILGVIPSIIALITGSFALLGFGLLMIMGAGGDAAIIIKLLTYKTEKKDVILMDHPTKIGMLVLEK